MRGRKPSSRIARHGSAGSTARTKAAPVPAFSKSLPVTLKRNATMDDVITTVMRACRDHWEKNLSGAASGQSLEALHQVRVSLRRLRSALAAFKDFIPTAQRKALNQEAKWLLKQLGPARDLDVFVQELAAPVTGQLSHSTALVQLMRAARRAQEAAHVQAGKALKGARARRLAARLDAWISGRGWRNADARHDARKTQALDFARRNLNRRIAKVREAYGDVEALSVDQRHELRIALKKIRYALEFFNQLLPVKRAGRLGTLIKALQDSLGHLNDLQVAERTIGSLIDTALSGSERLQIAAGGKTIGAWHAKAVAKAEPETFKLWRKFKKAPTF